MRTAVKKPMRSFQREILDLLKEQRALFAAMVAYASAIVVVLFKAQKVIEQWHRVFPDTSVQVLFAIAFAPILIPIFVVAFRRKRRSQLEHRLATAGETPAAFKKGYFRTAPYDDNREDRKAFARADDAHEEALCRIRKAAESKNGSFFLLHSPSGCGKTSLLKAYVIPVLRDHDCWQVITLRGFTAIIPELASLLNTTDEAAPEVLAAKASTSERPLLLVIDQFEEFLIHHTPASSTWNAVRKWFACLRANPVRNLLVLVSIRSEYQPAALALGLPDFDISNSFAVPLFTVQSARAFLKAGIAIIKKGRQTNENVIDEFIRQMEDRDDLHGLVRPVQANLVGHAYNAFADEFHRRLLAGDQVDFLSDWLRRLLHRRELRIHARAVLGALLQKDGSRRPNRVDDIADQANLQSDVVRHCLTAFQREGLVRCLSEENQGDNLKLWEISHDFLAVQIKRIISFWHRLWYESLARVGPITAFILWLVAAIVFMAQDVDRSNVIKLGKIGFYWDSAKLSASTQDRRLTPTALADAVPLLRALGCESIRIFGGDELQNIDSISNIPTLKNLDVSFCRNIAKIKSFDGLPKLANLSLSSDSSLSEIDGLNNLQHLKILNLSGCTKLESLGDLRDLTALTLLDLSGCSNLRNIDEVSAMKSLASLNLRGCPSLENINGLENHSLLNFLWLSQCYPLRNFTGLRGLTNLLSLDISECNQFTDMGSFKDSLALKNLNLSGCSSLKQVPGLSRHSELAALDLSKCNALVDVEGIHDLERLTKLDLSECKELSSLNGMRNLPLLENVKLSRCSELSNIDAIANFPTLRKLEMIFCSKIQKVDALGQLRSLVSLQLTFCGGLSNMNWIKELSSLQMLNLDGSTNLENIEGLQRLDALKYLYLGNCHSLTNFEPIAKLSILKVLDLHGCPQLETIPPLSNLVSLESIELTSCEQLKNIEGLAGLQQMHALFLSGCKSLRDVRAISSLKGLKNIWVDDLPDGVAEQIQDLVPKNTAVRNR